VDELIQLGVEAAPRTVLVGMDRAELGELVARLGQPPYRGRQIADWSYRRLAEEFAEMTDLSAGLRDRLTVECRLHGAEVVARQEATDGAVKLLLQFQDERRVETVLLPYGDRTSVCISSQVGCPVGCVFCSTAAMGFLRNLTAGEMVDQVLRASQEARRRGVAERVSHVVVMGMGEPLINYDPLLKAIRLLGSECGISPRRVTVSTAGYVPGIRRLAQEGLPVTLALSLHAPVEELRADLIPLSHRFPLAEVMAAVREYWEATGRRVTLEYILLAGVNDNEEQARQLVDLARDTLTHVNLIPFNPGDTPQPFQRPSHNRVRRFRELLEQGGLSVTQRVERGTDIAAACGQLYHAQERRRRTHSA
jgi:23S rRNA (adenine2503-C2)-methyltransferase